MYILEPCADRAAVNLWAPPTPISSDRRAAADRLLAPRRNNVRVFNYFVEFFLSFAWLCYKCLPQFEILVHTSRQQFVQMVGLQNLIFKIYFKKS